MALLGKENLDDVELPRIRADCLPAPQAHGIGSGSQKKERPGDLSIAGPQ
jgi:hypothetical protein